MAKIQIEIKDFELFYEAVKTTSKVIESAKFSISNIGMEVYGARARTARCEITTNAIVSSCAPASRPPRIRACPSHWRCGRQRRVA